MYCEYDDETLRELQKVQLDILKDLIGLCERHELKYFLFYGSAIGAVRHKGFIPWDDDIDICMMRDDYLNFIRFAEEELSKNYKVMGPDTENKYYNFVPNLNRRNTTYTTYYDRGRYECGIFIDIFPLDFTYEDKKKRAKQIRYAQLYRNLYLLKNVNYLKIEEKGISRNLKHFICSVIHFLLNFLHISERFLYKRFLKYVTECTEEKKYITTFHDSGITTTLSVMKWEEAFPLKDAEFNGVKVKLPNCSQEILTRVYGDYMQLPPVEERFNHPPYRLSFDNKQFFTKEPKKR